MVVTDSQPNLINAIYLYVEMFIEHSCVCVNISFSEVFLSSMHLKKIKCQAMLLIYIVYIEEVYIINIITV